MDAALDRADVAIATVLVEEYTAVLAVLGAHVRDPGTVAPNTFGWELADVAMNSGTRHRVVVALSGRAGPRPVHWRC